MNINLNKFAQPTGPMFMNGSLVPQPQPVQQQPTVQQFYGQQQSYGQQYNNNGYKPMNGNGPSNQGKLWSESDKRTIIKKYEEGTPILEIAALMDRSEKSIVMQLKNLGAIINDSPEKPTNYGGQPIGQSNGQQSNGQQQQPSQFNGQQQQPSQFNGQSNGQQSNGLLDKALIDIVGETKAEIDLLSSKINLILKHLGITETATVTPAKLDFGPIPKLGGTKKPEVVNVPSDFN